MLVIIENQQAPLFALPYEVHYKQKIDPLNFFFDDLNAEEYDSNAKT